MKHIAEHLDMDPLDLKEALLKDKDENLPSLNEEADNTALIDDSKEDGLIDQGYMDLDEIKKTSLNTGRLILELTENSDPRYKGRMFELANECFKTSMEAVKASQSQAFKSKEHNFKRATTGIPSQVTNTQVNNYYGTRDAVMEMIKNGAIDQIEESETNE